MIPFKLGKTLGYRRIYLLTQEEQEILVEYIKKNLDKEYI